MGLQAQIERGHDWMFPEDRGVAGGVPAPGGLREVGVGAPGFSPHPRRSADTVVLFSQPSFPSRGWTVPHLTVRAPSVLRVSANATGKPSVTGIRSSQSRQGEEPRS